MSLTESTVRIGRQVTAGLVRMRLSRQVYQVV